MRVCVEGSSSLKRQDPQFATYHNMNINFKRLGAVTNVDEPPTLQDWYFQEEKTIHRGISLDTS